jgi:hypothetical protein
LSQIPVDAIIKRNRVVRMLGYSADGAGGETLKRREALKIAAPN